jgi:hypothetical protein
MSEGMFWICFLIFAVVWSCFSVYIDWGDKEDD